MAINKRKDSAALFELIDKSTLRVPKQTPGALKIPSWWSSKTNPPATGAGAASGAANGNGARVSILSRPAVEAKSATETATPKEEASPTAEEAEAPQPRLFDPEANGAGASPSIRPPAPETQVRMASTNGNGANGRHANGGTGAATIDPAELPMPEEGDTARSGQEGYAGSGNGRRPFLPQTMSQTAGAPRDWMSSQKFRLGRAPMWMLVSGGAAVVIVLVLIVYGLMSLRAKPNKTDSSQRPSLVNTAPAPVTPPPGILPPVQHAQNGTPGQTNNGQSAVVTPVPPPNVTPVGPVTPGHAYESQVVTRSGNLNYVLVLTTPSLDFAKRDALFIAEKGVDVSIETPAGHTGRPVYKIISVKGFNSITEAQPLKKQIVSMGPSFKQTWHSSTAWDDATVMRGSSLPGIVK